MTFRDLIPLLKRNLITTIGSVCIIACALVYFVRQEQINRLATDYDDLSVRRARVLKNLKFGDGLGQELLAIQDLEKDARSRLFNPRDLAANYNYFFQIESATGVKLSDLRQFDKPVEKPAKGTKQRRRRPGAQTFQPLAFEMNVTGTYPKVLDFVRNLEGGRAYCRLEKLAVGSVGSSAEGSGEIVARLSIEILGNKS